jgi:hypothetical protein
MWRGFLLGGILLHPTTCAAWKGGVHHHLQLFRAEGLF